MSIFYLTIKFVQGVSEQLIYPCTLNCYISVNFLIYFILDLCL